MVDAQKAEDVMSNFDDLPIKKGDEWGVVFESPFTTTVEDIIKVYSFEEWRTKGRVPSAYMIHRRLHKSGHGRMCPGRLHVARLCNQFKREIS